MSTELFRVLRKGAVPMAVINPDTGLPPQRRDYGKLLCCDRIGHWFEAVIVRNDADGRCMLVADERGVLHDAHRIFWSIISWRPPGAAVGRARAICH